METMVGLEPTPRAQPRNRRVDLPFRGECITRLCHMVCVKTPRLGNQRGVAFSLRFIFRVNVEIASVIVVHLICPFEFIQLARDTR